ncbi:MAG: hypothetical protein AB7L92_03885 [Alphaproteobacteria bacterium]
MQVINTNAHAILFEKANHLQKNPHSSWRCIYINLSAHRLRHNRTLLANFIGKAVKRILEDSEGHIFMCQDGDIFILFQGMLRPMLEKLGEHFDGMTLDDQGQPVDPLFTILDLSSDWDVFYHLCLSKSRQYAPVWQKTASAKVPYNYRELPA